jgi:hypothetical protein
VVIGGVGSILVVAAGWWLFPALRDVEDPAEVTPETANRRADVSTRAS